MRILIFFLFLISCAVEQKEYKVKLIFCDGRDPKIQTVRSSQKPSTKDIRTDGAVPTFGGCGCGGVDSPKYLNVCDLIVLSEGV